MPRPTATTGEPATTADDSGNDPFAASETSDEGPAVDESSGARPGKRKRIPAELPQRIKQSISIVDAVESYGLPGFSRTGGGVRPATKACCLFHDDYNPSMSVDDSLGLYKCFACGAGGDVFNFVREHDHLARGRRGERMGYMAAVGRAAREFGDAGLLGGADWSAAGGGDAAEGLSEEAAGKMRARERTKDR